MAYLIMASYQIIRTSVRPISSAIWCSYYNRGGGGSAAQKNSVPGIMKLEWRSEKVEEAIRESPSS